MRIILVALPQKFDEVTFETMDVAPLALYLLASVLKKEKHTVTVIDPCEFLYLQGKKRLDELCAQYVIEKVISEKIDSVAFSVNTFNWANSKVVVDLLGNKCPEVNIVLGGLHATIFSEHLLKVSKANIVIRGEGEITIVNLYNALENNKGLGQIKGITYKNNNIIIRNEDSEVLTLEQMINTPYPSYDLLPTKNPYKQLPVESSRGCYYSCAFCSIPNRHNWRGLPADEVINRTKHALKYKTFVKNGVYILFVDDCFTANRESH